MKKIAIITLSMCVVISTLGIYLPSTYVRGNGYGNYPPPVIGDWIITTDTYVGNETIILTGNLTVESGATLTYRNVTLIINSTPGGSAIEDFYHIEVKKGGTMNILDIDNDNTTKFDASIITIYDTNAYYWFWVRDGSNFTMKNSELHECGGWSVNTGGAGLMVYTDNATIDRCYINNCYQGIILYSSDAVVSNNTISWSGLTGIQATAWSNGTIENNVIEWSGTYGIHVNGRDNVKNWGSNPLIKGNTIYKTGRDGINQGDALQIETSSHPVLIDNDVIDWGEDGMYIWYRCTFDAESLLLQPDGGNFCIAGAGGLNWVRLTNSTLLSSVNYDVALTGTYVVFTNTTYDNADVAFGDTISNFTARWFLHTYVNDSFGNPIPDATLQIQDNANGTYDRNFTTKSDGWVNWTVLTEYYQNMSTTIGFNPYNITVSKSGYDSAYAEVVMNESKYITITLGDLIPPSHSNEIPLPESYKDAPGTNVSVHVTDPSGVNESTIQLYVNGSLVSPTLTSITDGYNISWESGGFDPGVIECRIIADDNLGNHLDYTWNFTVLATFKIPLRQGWNLISVPLVQVNNSIAEVLKDIAGKWDYIQVYNATDQDHWKTNLTYRPEQLNDLTTLNHKMGFWINVTEPNVNLTVRGNISAYTIIPLSAGWNLVGYPTQATETVGNALWGTGADRVEVFNATDPYRTKEVASTYIMKPGEGYWVHATYDTTWVVNW